jgi:hypothetical protein
MAGLLNRFNRFRLAYRAGIVIFLTLVFIGIALTGLGDPVFLESAGEKNTSTVELTKYQQNYVDCPAEYLELCTKMSKIPTEEVVFERAEDGLLYLHRPRRNCTLVANIEGRYLVNSCR